MQDVLGEMHDLSVLEQAIAKDKRDSMRECRSAWRQEARRENGPNGCSNIAQRCRGRILRCESCARDCPRKGNCGPLDWRGSPNGHISLRPDITRARRAAKLALQLYDGFANCGLAGRDVEIAERPILHAAALLQEVGHFKKDKWPTTKSPYRMIRGIPPPPGWTKRSSTRGLNCAISPARATSTGPQNSEDIRIPPTSIGHFARRHSTFRQCFPRKTIPGRAAS